MQIYEKRAARETRIGLMLYKNISSRPTQDTLVNLANKWEPEASNTPPGRRLSKCASCGSRMWFPWHIWLHDGGFKKELHICNRCWKKIRKER